MMIQRYFILLAPVMLVLWIRFIWLLVPWYANNLHYGISDTAAYIIIYMCLSCTMLLAMAPVMTYTHILKKENIWRQRPWEVLLLFFPAYAPLATFASALFYPPISDLIYEYSEEGLFDLLTLLLAVTIFFALPLTPVFFLLRYFARRMLEITSAADNHSAPVDKQAGDN